MTTTPAAMMPIDDPQAPTAAARAVAEGGVIAFPTDTVYGVGAGLWLPDAVRRLYEVKGRPDEKALPVLMADVSEWMRVASALPAGARALMETFWPGALTIVLPRRADVPDAVGPLTATIAVRVPAHAALRRVLMRTGPLATSSANPSGRAPAGDAATVRADLGSGLALVLDGGTLPPSAPSTVVDLSGPDPIVLRLGALGIEALASVLARPLALHSPAN